MSSRSIFTRFFFFFSLRYREKKKVDSENFSVNSFLTATIYHVTEARLGLGLNDIRLVVIVLLVVLVIIRLPRGTALGEVEVESYDGRGTGRNRSGP